MTARTRGTQGKGRNENRAPIRRVVFLRPNKVDRNESIARMQLAEGNHLKVSKFRACYI